jgi:hypothetical protein
MDKIAYYKAYIYKTAEEIRYNKRNKQHINKIDTLAQGNLMLQLKYKDKKGKITTPRRMWPD